MQMFLITTHEVTVIIILYYYFIYNQYKRLLFIREGVEICEQAEEAGAKEEPDGGTGNAHGHVQSFVIKQQTNA